jgi:hypothetical protein
MSFGPTDIIRAIRNRQYQNDPNSGDPFAIPVAFTQVGTPTAGNYGFCGITAARNVALEIVSVVEEPDGADLTPPQSVWALLRKSAFDGQAAAAAPTYLDSHNGVALQKGARDFARSLTLGGYFGAGGTLGLSVAIKSGIFAGPIVFPDPIILFGDSDPAMFVAYSSVVTKVLHLSVYAREWPLDPANY